MKKKSCTLNNCTELSMRRAYDRAAAKFKVKTKGCSLIGTMESAGFIVPKGQKRGERKAYQVFVKIARFDEALCLEHPETGGLLE